MVELWLVCEFDLLIICLVLMNDEIIELFGFGLVEIIVICNGIDVVCWLFVVCCLCIGLVELFYVGWLEYEKGVYDVIVVLLWFRCIYLGIILIIVGEGI